MISVAAGLAAAGKIPFASTFAKFVMRGYDQIEMAIICGANLKITGTHAGITLAADGPSQMSCPDVAFFRSFCHVKNYDGQPAVRYFFPSDAVSCYRITELMANVVGCCYQRTLRADTALFTNQKNNSKSAGSRCCARARTSSSSRPATWCTSASRPPMTLAKNGKKAAVVDAYSMPLNSARRAGDRPAQRRADHHG